MLSSFPQTFKNFTNPFLFFRVMILSIGVPITQTIPPHPWQCSLYSLENSNTSHHQRKLNYGKTCTFILYVEEDQVLQIGVSDVEILPIQSTLSSQVNQLQQDQTRSPLKTSWVLRISYLEVLDDLELGLGPLELYLFDIFLLPVILGTIFLTMTPLASSFSKEATLFTLTLALVTATLR